MRSWRSRPCSCRPSSLRRIAGSSRTSSSGPSPPPGWSSSPTSVRPEIFEYLLDHPEFASHVTRALKAARYKIWREAGSLWLDDGWGVKGTFALAHAEPGLRLMYAQGAYQSALPDIKGRAVVALAYRFQPTPQAAASRWPPC